MSSPTSGDVAPTTEATGPSRPMLVWLLVGLTALAVGVVVLVVPAGDTLTGGVDAVVGVDREPAAIDAHDVLWRILIAASLIILLARLFGALFQRIGQPQVIGEIVAGIALGPSLLSATFPGLADEVFTGEVLPVIEVLAQIGLIVFMFLIGLEFDVALLRGRGGQAALISHASLVVPFIGGILLAPVLFTHLGPEGGDFLAFALFLGAAMSVTAFPVLARILTERGLHRTRLGGVAITCAAVGDVAAWCLLAVVVAIASQNGPASAVSTVVLSLAFILVMLLAVRPLVARVATWREEGEALSPTVVALLFVGLLLSALATDRIGIHAIFGAFLFGAVMPKRGEFVEDLTAKLVDFTVIFLLPLFFAYSGLRTDVRELGTDPLLWVLTGLILVVAIAGKWGGAFAAARFVGMPTREAHGIGILMNCRGLTELVILNIGLDLGVIPPALFTSLVIMALVTTLMTSPLLSAVYGRERLQRSADDGAGGETPERARWEIVVHLPNLDRAYELVHTALSLAHDQQQQVRVVLLRTLVLDTDLTSGTLAAGSATERAAKALRPIAEFVRGAGYEAVPLVVQSASMADTIVSVAAGRRPDLVLMTWRRPLFGSGVLHGPVGEVLRRAHADVAVLIDPAGKGTSPRKGSEILVPYAGGFHEGIGLELALRLARTHGASVRLLGDGSSGDLANEAAEAYERSGVSTTAAASAGDLADATIEASRSADLVVLGVGDDWADDSESLGDLREVVAARSPTPTLLVRRNAAPDAGPRRGRRRLAGRPSRHPTPAAAPASRV